MDQTKKRVFTVIKVIVSISLLVILISRADVRSLATHYTRVTFPFLLLAVSLVFLQAVVSTIKWKYILKADGVHLPFLFLLKTYMISNFLSLFLPTSFGGDVYRIAAVRGVKASFGKSTSSVLFDRVTGLFAMVSIALTAGFFIPNNPYQWWLLAAYLAGPLLFLILTSQAVIQKLRAYSPGWLSFLYKLLDSFNAYRKDQRGLLMVIAIAFIFQFNVVVITKVYALGLKIPVPFYQLMVVVPLIYMTEALPFSINGFGIRESAFVFFFLRSGRTAEEGLALSLFSILIRYLYGILGWFLLLVDNFNKKQEKLSSSLPE